MRRLVSAAMLVWVLWGWSGGQWRSMGIYDSQETCEATLQEFKRSLLEKKVSPALRAIAESRFCNSEPDLDPWDSKFLYSPGRK